MQNNEARKKFKALKLKRDVGGGGGDKSMVIKENEPLFYCSL